MPRGKFYFFTGLDGSGKTTQAEIFLSHHPNSNWDYRWTRWEPYLTRPLMWFARVALRRGRGGGRPEEDREHAQFQRGKQNLFRSAWRRRVWTTVVLLEYLPQAWWRMLPPLWRGRRVICDRYLPDVWIDLALNYGLGPDGVEGLSRHPLCRLFPRPDVTLLFDVEPEIGFDRKRDGTPLAYLQDRVPLYRGLGKILPTRVIDANGSLEEVAAQVDEQIHRTKARAFEP